MLTGIFSYPSYFESKKLIRGFGDPIMYLNTFWWYNFNSGNLVKQLDFFWILFQSLCFIFFFVK